MAKTKKKASIPDAQFRRHAIEFYVSKKRKDPTYQPRKDQFVKDLKVPRRQLISEFGTYHDFLKDAEAEYLRSIGPAQRALLSERSKKFCINATKDECIDDLRAVQLRDPLRCITRNIYRTEGKYSDSTWNQFFGTFQEFRRQADIELSRTQHALERGIAKQASVDHYRNFYKAQILPWYKKYQKDHLPSTIKTMKVVSDIHDLECDEFGLAVFIAECERTQPDVIVFNGDIFDLIEFGKYSIDLRSIKIKERFDFVKYRIFKPIREKCPNAQIDMIMGNHEFRIIRLLADATPNLRVLLSDVMGLGFADVFGLEEFQINWVSKIDLGVYSKKDLNNEMKQNYQVYFGCYVVCHEPDAKLMHSMSGTNGHHHKARQESDANLTFGAITWIQTPGLHIPDAEYLKNLSGWNMGFLNVTINLETQQVSQHVVQTHSDWCEVNGILYERKEV